MTFTPALCLTALLGLVAGDIFVNEKFDDVAAVTKRWVQSTHEGKEFGEMKVTTGEFQGLQTSQDARFYGFSREFDKTYSTDEKPLVIQFSVKHNQTIDCGGGYVKIFPSGTDLASMHGETPYQIMFGPDICGYSTKKVHVILNHGGKNHDNKKEIRCKDDDLTHFYTLIVRPDNTYEVKIDNEKVESGSLEEDWDIVKPKKIKDPEAKKPQDWEDSEFIDDADDKKPADWDKPETIPDANAKKPEDWDAEMDGEWEPPMITNPDFKGEWKARQIKNPKYKGVWEQPEIDNPEYKPMPELYKFKNMGAIGFDLWQVKSGTIFGHILITDDISEAEQHAKDSHEKIKEVEKKIKEIEEEKRKAEEAKLKESGGDKADKKPEDDMDEDLDDTEDKEAEKKDRDEL